PGPMLLVISRSDTVGSGPDVNIHEGCIGIEPVGRPVLGWEARPRLGERQVWHVVVPNGRVQRERRVALAPSIGWAFALIDDERRHTKLLEARAQAETCLPGADDHAIGLLCDAEFGLLAAPLLSPVWPPRFVSQRPAVRAALAGRLLESD